MCQTLVELPNIRLLKIHSHFFSSVHTYEDAHGEAGKHFAMFPLQMPQKEKRDCA